MKFNFLNRYVDSLEHIPISRKSKNLCFKNNGFDNYS